MSKRDLFLPVLMFRELAQYVSATSDFETSDVRPGVDRLDKRVLFLTGIMAK